MPSPELLAALAAAPTPRPFSLEAFLDRISAQRQRPLHLHDLPDEAAGAVSGLWIGTREADHIFVAPGASGMLRVLIVLHEISHMLLKHGVVLGGQEEVLRRMVGDMTGLPEIQGLAGRSRFETKEERDAEKLATLILAQALDEPLDEGDEGLRRLSRTFGYET